MSTPFFDLIEELRALGGAPKVTYPTGNNNYPQTERTIKAKRGTQILALGSPEPDTVRFPNNILTEQIELRSDAQAVEVYRKYEVLPGPFTKQGQEYDPEYGFLTEWTEGEVKNGVAIGTALSDVEPENYIKSNLKTYAIPTAALNAFFLTFPGTADIDFPKTLIGIVATWDVTVGTGTFEESGSGIAAGTNANLNLSAQGRGQGSASVLADIAPVFAPQPPPNLPVVDYFFFLPNPVGLNDILTRATAIATALFSQATTVNPWPLFQAQEYTFIITGQKVSVSCEASARVAISIASSDESSVTSSGNGKNVDFGSTVRAITIPPSIHGPITIQGATTNSSTSSASAYAYEDISGIIAGTMTPTTLSTVANGSIVPGALQATPVRSLPASGLYLYKPDVAPYKWGYSTVRARIFDFSILALPQITVIDFTYVTGANYVTGGAGKSFVLPSLGPPTPEVWGVWFNTGTENQPDLSANGVTNYLEVNTTSGANAGNLQTALGSAVEGSSAMLAIWTPSGTGYQVIFTANVNGLTAACFDINSGVFIVIDQFGKP